MYTAFLHIHHYVAWLVLILAVVVILKSLAGLFGGMTYQKLDNILAASFVGTMHLQLLVGLILYIFLSPSTQEAFENMGEAMSNPALRFYAVEHIAVMILAVISAQVGRSISKKSSDSLVKFRFQAIFFSIALFLVITRIPWERLMN